MAKDWKSGKRASGAPFYFLGFIGSVVYYMHTTTGFGSSVVAILKALVWPAFLVYHLLGL